MPSSTLMYLIGAFFIATGIRALLQVLHIRKDRDDIRMRLSCSPGDEVKLPPDRNLTELVCSAVLCFVVGIVCLVAGMLL